MAPRQREDIPSYIRDRADATTGLGLQFSGAAVIVIALLTILHIDEAGGNDIVLAPDAVAVTVDVATPQTAPRLPIQQICEISTT